LINLVVLVKWGIKVNWATMVFNNLYSRLWNLFALTKLEANRNNTKFGVAQVVDILLRNWFLIDLTFILPDFDEEDESAVRIILKPQVVRGNRILKVHF
jgi:hypothetical protein